MEAIVPFGTSLKKYRPSCILTTRTIAAAALLTFISPPVVLSAEPAIGTVTALRGTAVIKRPGVGDPLPVKVGMPFLVGDIVETAGGSAVQLSLSDESFMNLAPGASVRVNQYFFDLAKNRRTAIVKVLSGKVRCILFRVRSADSSFRVETGTALVTSGILADCIVLSRQGVTDVAAIEHGVTVRSSLPYVIGDVRVEVNQRTAVREKAPPSAPVVLSPRERKELLEDVKKI